MPSLLLLFSKREVLIMNSKIQKEKGGSQDDKVYKLVLSLYPF